MHLVVTDVLTCPVCGPAHGLVMLAHRMQERRVLEGALGCPGCERQYPVRGGLADLAVGAAASFGSVGPASDEEAVRVAAFGGLAHGRGVAVLVGAPAGQAEGLGRLLEGIESIVLADGADAVPETGGVNRLRVSPGGLPLASRSIRAVAASGPLDEGLLAEIARVLGVGARLVWFAPPEGAVARLPGSLRVLAADGTVVVAVREGL